MSDQDFVVFISHRWLSRNHPDDATKTKYRSILKGLKSWAEQTERPLERLHIWFDFSSIDNDDEVQRVRGSVGGHVALRSF